MNKHFKFNATWRVSSLVGLIWVLSMPALAQEVVEKATLKQMPAVKTAGINDAMMLAAGHAGKRIVAVGDRGIILLSDDAGKNFRQAETVPTRATLTSVNFVSEREGWAVGHWGVVLHTIDGGETWVLQRDDLNVDRPFFAVWFKDTQTGFASGLWSLLLRTDDGGKSWNKVELPRSEGRDAEKNLFSIFSGPKDDLFIAAEHGSVFRSADEGRTWNEVATGNAGTFWAGMTLKNGVILVAGLRGKIYRSTDDGGSWSAIESGTKSSITGIAERADGSVVMVGLDGITLQSVNAGASFSLSVRPDQMAYTALITNGSSSDVKFTAMGVKHSTESERK